MEVECRCSGEWAAEGKAFGLTFCLVELSKGVLTDIPVSEEHAELTSAQVGPDIFGVDCPNVSEEL